MNRNLSLPLLFALSLLAGCSRRAEILKPLAIDDLAIQVRDTSREVSFTNKESGFLYLESNAEPRSGWEGWTIMSTTVLSDVRVSIDGKALRGSEVRNSVVLPYQLTRTYADQSREVITLLDSLDAIVFDYSRLQGDSISASAFFRNSQDSSSYVTAYDDGVLLVARKDHPARTDRENYPVWIGLMIAGQTAGWTASGIDHAQLFSPASVKGGVVDRKATAVVVAGDSRDETVALARFVSANFPRLVEHRKARMQKILDRAFFRTDDPQWDKALAWATLSMDALIMNQRTKGIFAGLPWFSDYWGRDSFIALPGATLVTGDFADARSILLSFAAWQEKNPASPDFGRIPNLVTTNSIAYNTADGTLWFLYALYEYVNYSGDTALARRLYPTVQRAVEGTILHHLDRFGFLTHGDAETWMDAVGPDGPWSPRGNRANDIQALWIRALNIASLFAHSNGDEQSARRWEGMSDRTYSNFQRFFVDSARGLVVDHLRSDGSADSSVRPNQLLTLEFIDDPVVRKTVFLNITQTLVYPHGVASLSQDDPNFHPFHHYEPFYVQDAAYHNGIVWTWLAGPWIQNACQLGKSNLAFTVTQSMVHQILDRGAVGTLSELIDAAPRPGETEPRLSGAFSQAWGLAEFIRVAYQAYAGISVNALSHDVWIYPELPAAIGHLSCNIPVGSGNILLDYSRTSGGAAVTLRSDSILPPTSIVVGVPIDEGRGRLCRLILNTGSELSFVASADGVTRRYDSDSTSLTSALQPLASLDELRGIHLATPRIDPNLRALRAAAHRMLSNAEIKLPSPTATLLYAADDPTGDDRGPGSYVYPSTPYLKPGSLDVTRFTVRSDDRNTTFMLRFRNLSDPGWHPEYGFQLTFAAIAIDKDGKPGSGQTLIGRNARYVLPSRFAYETVIYVGGGLRVEDSERNVIAEYAPVAGDERNPLGSAGSKTIEFSIPNSILGTPLASWHYTVVVGAQDDHGGAGIGDFRSVGRVAGEWTGGGKKDARESNIYDVIEPR
ncbi:MAG TPA: amylo-alpha-1,6-glucosidase [Bacteroidota bacterium]|nr:amylo-alpha-1,6-glucosidase [Bacteroidota bacterium]